MIFVLSPVILITGERTVRSNLMNLFYKKILFLIAIFAVFPLFALAAGVTVTSLIEAFMTNVVWPVASAVVIVLWIITGILFLTAQGNPEGLKKARLALLLSVGGTIVVVLAYSAIALVSNSLNLSGSSGS